MIGYIIRRVFQSVLVILGALLITFILFHLEGPQALARSIYTSPRATTAQLNQVIQLYGFNLPIWDQFWHEIIRYAHLDFGKSPESGLTTTSLIATDLPRSLILIGESTIFAVAIALPLGVFQTCGGTGSRTMRSRASHSSSTRCLRSCSAP